MKTIGEQIAEKIKEYRKKAGMTQEQMAGILGVTFQTVSKWECATSSPDLAMILPLTRLLGISADELLGVNDREPDQRYRELEAAYEKTFKTNDFAQRQRICETAVAEYPGDMKWLSELAWVVSNRSFSFEDNEKYAAEQEKAIRLFDAVIHNCKDERLRGDAVEGITQLLGWRGRKDEAKRYAEMLPERAVRTRESVMENCLEGEELLRFKQERLWSNLEGLLNGLSLFWCDDNDRNDLFRAKMKELLRVMIPDGNYLEFNHPLYYGTQSRVNLILRRGEGADGERVLHLLGEMKRYAADYDRIVFDKPGVYRYTSPMFDLIETDTRDWLGNESSTMTQDFAEYLWDAKFDFLRGTAAFRSLTE